MLFRSKRNSYPSRCCSDELTMYNVCTHSNVKHPQKQQPSLNLKFFWGSPSILNKSIKVSHLCHTPTNGQTLNSYLQHINNAIIAKINEPAIYNYHYATPHPSPKPHIHTDKELITWNPHPKNTLKKKIKKKTSLHTYM